MIPVRLAVALCRDSSRIGDRRIHAEDLRSEHVLAGVASLCSATVPCVPDRSQNENPMQPAAGALVRAPQGCSHLPPPRTIQPSVESGLVPFTLSVTLAALCRRNELGNRAETLKIDLARACIRAAAHLSYLTYRC